jgi:ABC-type amino acid transport system permease subunit
MTYFLLCFGLSRLAYALERRLSRRDPFPFVTEVPA